MAKQKETHRISTELITLQPTDNITVLPPNSGVVGTFLEQTANMFKARAMRMNGLLRRIDETGQRTEAMLAAANLSGGSNFGGTVHERRIDLQERHRVGRRSLVRPGQ